MPRLHVIDPQNASGKAKEIFEGPLKGKHFNIFKGLANSPVGLDFYLALTGALKDAGLTVKEREIIALAVGQENDCGYCLAAHTAGGMRAGLSEEDTLGARKGELADPKMGALVRFTKTLHDKKGFVSDEDLAAFKAAGYDDGHVVEVVATYALNVFTNVFNHINETEVDFPAPPDLK